MNDPPNITTDVWLSAILDQEVCRLRSDVDYLTKLEDKHSQESIELEKIMGTDVFIYAKLPTNYILGSSNLEKKGFYLVDTNATFSKTIGHNGILGTYDIRFASAQDELQTVNLARRSFSYSRFHLDPKISLNKANHIKGEWVRNYFMGKRGRYMILSLIHDHVVGFLLLLCDSSNTLIIDLIAVDKPFQGQGIASSMLAYAEMHCGNYLHVIAGSQVANVQSIRFYEKCGFRLSKVNYVFHYHHHRLDCSGVVDENRTMQPG